MLDKRRATALKSVIILSYKLHLSKELRHFRGSRFLQCFKLSTAPRYSLQSKLLYAFIFLSNYQ